MSGLESLIAGKDERIARLEGQVHELTERIKEMNKTHKLELQEVQVRMQQEMYLANHFREPGGTESKRTAGTRSSGGRGRTRHKMKEV